MYDVTTFLHKHPAGARSILRHAGQDASEDFSFHSKRAQKMWARYRIGKLVKKRKVKKPKCDGGGIWKSMLSAFGSGKKT